MTERFRYNELGHIVLEKIWLGPWRLEPTKHGRRHWVRDYAHGDFEFTESGPTVPDRKD